MSKVTNDMMRKAIEQVLAGAEEKKREFVETVELQIGLKNTEVVTGVLYKNIYLNRRLLLQTPHKLFRLA